MGNQTVRAAGTFPPRIPFCILVHLSVIPSVAQHKDLRFDHIPIAHYVSRNGRLYFGGEKGAVSFHPDSIKENTFLLPVVITSLQVLNNGYPLNMPKTFAHDMNSVAFEFVALDFTLPEKNQDAYMMDGVDQTWIQAGTRRYAQYPRLDPGTYTFRVRGSNNDGIWNTKGASMSFTITPPYLATWWFRVGVALLVLGLGVLARNFRVNRLLELERLRVKIASDLHDDIGSSLTHISLQSEFDPGRDCPDRGYRLPEEHREHKS